MSDMFLTTQSEVPYNTHQFLQRRVALELQYIQKMFMEGHDFNIIKVTNVKIKNFNMLTHDRLCGIVVRVSGYRYRGPGFDSRRYQIF
jgi:hypothetical protein